MAIDPVSPSIFIFSLFQNTNASQEAEGRPQGQAQDRVIITLDRLEQLSSQPFYLVAPHGSRNSVTHNVEVSIEERLPHGPDTKGRRIRFLPNDPALSRNRHGADQPMSLSGQAY